MSESEKSGLDLINELIEIVNLLSKKVDVIDQNIKKIANSAKVSELMNKASEMNLSGWNKPKASVQAVNPAEQAKGMRFNLEPQDASKLKDKVNKPPIIMTRGKVITYINNKPIHLPGITIKIYDKKNTLVKETKTNGGGEWRAGLSAGKFVMEITGKYKGNEMAPVNKVFEVPEGASEYEVI